MKKNNKTAQDLKDYYTDEYFSKHKRGYENYSRIYRFRLNKIFSNISIKKGESLLDLGCGMGTLSIECAKKGAKVTGLDYAKAAIENSKKIAKNMGIKASFVTGDSSKMLFKNNSFDKIIAADFTEHLDKDTLKKTFSECYRILKKGGEFLIFTPSPTHIIEILKINNIILKEDKSHIGLVKMGFLVSELRKVGFNIKLKKHTSTHLPIINWFEKLLIPITGLVRRRILIVATK